MRPLADLPETEPRPAERSGLAPLRKALSLPISLTRRFARRDRAEPVSPLTGMSTSDLRHQLSLTVIAGHPDRKALAQHLKPAIRDWQAQDWHNLGQRITRLDRRHAALPSGERLASALGRGLFRHVAGAQACHLIDRGQCVTDTVLSEDLFAPLIRAIAKRETDPAIHFLTALFNLETGWARRGEDHSDYAPEGALAAAQARFQVARNVIDAIASRAPHSAFFAELDYRVMAAEGATEDELTRAAIRWSRTDPTSLSPFAVHGVHLLPQWYGTDHSLGTYADRVWAKTHETLGAAGYAACYLSALGSDPGVLLSLNPDAFRDGLVDMMQASDDPDVTCNAILRTLWEVSCPDHGIEGRDTSAMRRARRDLRDTFIYLVRHTLGPVMPDAWGPSWTEPRILHALAEAFSDEIRQGRQVAIGLDGATIEAAF